MARVVEVSLRIRRRTFALIAAWAAVLGLMAVLFVTLRRPVPTVVTGEVRCLSGAQVAGIYVFGSRTGFATPTLDPNNKSVATFYYPLPDGGSYLLHIGCGFKPDNSWLNSGATAFTSGSGHVFACNDTYPTTGYKPCTIDGH